MGYNSWNDLECRPSEEKLTVPCREVAWIQPCSVCRLLMCDTVCVFIKYIHVHRCTMYIAMCMLYIALLCSLFQLFTYLFAGTHVHRVFSVPCFELISYRSHNQHLAFPNLPYFWGHRRRLECMAAARNVASQGSARCLNQTVHVLQNMEPWSLHPFDSKANMVFLKIMWLAKKFPALGLFYDHCICNPKEKLKNLGFLELGYEYVVVDDYHLAARRKVRMVRRPLAGRWQSMAVWWRYLSISRSFFIVIVKE